MGCGSGCEKQSTIVIRGINSEQEGEKVRQALIALEHVEDAFLDPDSGACIINHFAEEGIGERIHAAIVDSGFTTAAPLKTL